MPGRIDADGDGLSEARVDPTSGVRLATQNDNCAPPDGADADTAARYTNPTQADIDGDGVGDVCDVCPSVHDPEQSSCVAVRAATAESSPTGVALTPGDLVGTACVRRGAYDRDGDGVLDVCDNCVGEAPGVMAFNPNQLDDDGDGIGNTCDVCPDDPDPTRSNASTGDLDGDGVGDACGDNCVGVRNPDQANCNLDAELVVGLASIAGERIVGRVGDACDPTPCGETRLGLVSEVAAGGAFGAGSRVAATRALQVDGRSTNAQEARTGFRFCRCALAETDDVDSRSACSLSLGPLGGGCAISLVDEYDAALADIVDEAEVTWRFTSVGDVPSPPTPNTEIDATYAFNPSRADFDPSLETRWDLEADAQRWASVFGDVAPPGGLTWTLPGVLWTHTPGGPTSTASVFEPAVRTLSSHYWSGGVSRVEGPREVPGCVRYLGPLIPSRGCPLCDAAFPTPFLGLPHTDRFCRGVPRPPTLISPGLDLDLPDLLPVDPRDPAPLDWSDLLTREDLRWVAASEPAASRPAVSTPRAGLRLVAVDERGQLVVRVRDGARGLVADGHDFGSPCVPGQCEVVTPPFACGQGGPRPSDATLAGSITESQRFTNVSGSVTSSPNGRRTYVLSSRREVLFSVRGDRPTRSGVVSATLLPADGSSDVFDDRSVELGQVLAATYEPIQDVLYVLDEVEERRGWRVRRHARLVRVGLHGVPREDATAVLPVEIVAEWPRIGLSTRFALSPGVDGTLWLVASGGAAHTVLRLDASSVLRVLGVTVGAGALTEVPVAVDGRGLSYVTEDLLGRERARGVRVRDLRVPRGTEVSSCF
ncbi:MAG: thrombospondin type 3 repeat-containing protein [Sandaracinus sp.]|nr:thrombospondin type 3 repeat-containing protein [Sandaracinus sp.]